MNILALLLSLAVPPASIDIMVVPTIDAETLLDVRIFNDQRVRMRARLTSVSLTPTGYVYGVSSDRHEINLELPRGTDRTGSTVLVLGTLRAIRHPARNSAAAFVEFRIVEATVLSSE